MTLWLVTGVADWPGAHRTNLTGAITVFKTIRQSPQKVPVAYASSAPVCGNVTTLPTVETKECMRLHPRVDAPVFNACTVAATSALELAGTIAGLAGKPLDVRYLPPRAGRDCKGSRLVRHGSKPTSVIQGS